MIRLYYLIWVHHLKHSNHTLISNQVLAKHVSNHVPYTFLQTSSHFSLKNGRKKRVGPMSKTNVTLFICSWALPGSVESVEICFFPLFFILFLLMKSIISFRVWCLGWGRGRGGEERKNATLFQFNFPSKELEWWTTRSKFFRGFFEFQVSHFY